MLINKLLFIFILLSVQKQLQSAGDSSVSAMTGFFTDLSSACLHFPNPVNRTFVL